MSLGLKYKNNEQIFVERQRGGVPYLSYPLLENTGIVNHGFSTRLGGVSTGCFSSMNISLTRGDDPEAVKKGDRQKTVLSIPYKSTSGTGDNSRGLPPDTRAAPEGQ